MALIILVVSMANILCFYIGCRFGQSIDRGEGVRLPDPVQEVQERVQESRERRENKREQDRIDVILANVENYDGTGYGQRDVPGKE